MLSKLTKGQKFAYSICRIGTSVFMNVATVATVWIYDNIFGLKDYPYLNSAAVASGKIIIAFSSFLFGYISDIIPAKKIGRRKFFIWTGAPLLAISFVMLFIPHLFIQAESTWSVFSWLFVWNAMFNIFYGYLTTPHQSWMAEISTEDDRVQISSFQNTANLIASLFGTGYIFLLPSILDLQEGEVLTTQASNILLITIVVFAVLEVLFFLPALFVIKDEPVERIERNVIREFSIVFKNRNYVIWFMAQGVYSMGLIFLTTVILDFSTDILGFTGMVETIIFGLSMFGTIMLSFILWVFIARKIGKKNSVLIGFGFLIVILPLSLIFKVLSAGTIAFTIMGYVYGFLLGLGISASQVFPYAIIADIADKDERETNESRAGMYTGFNSIPLNIFQAISIFFLVGYFGNEAFQERLFWMGPVTAIFILAAIPIIMLGNFDPFKEITNGEAYKEAEAMNNYSDELDGN